jgi:hypothetical protein
MSGPNGDVKPDFELNDPDDLREEFARIDKLMCDELDDNLAQLGPWIEKKRPRSVEARRHLTAILRGWRCCRGPGFVSPVSDADYLRVHRDLKRCIIAAEDAFAPIRKAYFEWLYKSVGGVQ